MSINLAEDFRRRFSAPVPVPAPKVRQVPVPEPEPEIDLVVAPPPPKPVKKAPTPSEWESNIDTLEAPDIKPPKVREVKEPIIRGNRKFLSNATANWASIRKSLYPTYKTFCANNDQKPSVYEFNSIIGPRWKSLSQEDKVKAVANPEAYFSF